MWDNNVDTVHGSFLTVVSDRFLNEVRGQYSRYTDRRAAKCDCVSIQRAAYANSGGYDQGTWGVLPEKTFDLSNTLSLWMGNHSMKTGASFTYDVTRQLFQPLRNGVYFFSGAPSVAPTPFQYRQSGPRTSLSMDANINRGTKQGFLDMNQAQPIPKDVLNAANGATIRTQAQADATRPIRPTPNSISWETRDSGSMREDPTSFPGGSSSSRPRIGSNA